MHPITECEELFTIAQIRNVKTSSHYEKAFGKLNINTLYLTAMSIWSEHLQKETLKKTDPALYGFLVELEEENTQHPIGKVGSQDSDNEHKQARLKQSRRIKMTNLCHVRNQKHLTQHALSRASGISRRTIAGIENGRNTPSVFVALALATALDCRVEDLFYLGMPDEPVNDFTTGQATIMRR